MLVSFSIMITGKIKSDQEWWDTCYTLGKEFFNLS